MYIVIYFDDDDRMHVKNAQFSTYEEAHSYALTIANDREPRVFKAVSNVIQH